MEKLQDLGGKQLLTSTGMQSSAATQLGCIYPSLQGQDGGTIQNVNKSTVRHTRNLPVPHVWISGSFQKYNLPPSMGHKTNLPFSSSRSILISALAPEHKLPDVPFYDTDPELQSPAQQASSSSSANQTSCRTSPAPPFRTRRRPEPAALCS